MFFDHDGQPMSIDEWAHAYEDYASRVLARTQVGEAMVITVWLGFDEDYDNDGAPLIFGSIIKLDGKYSDAIRTSTQEQANAAHVELVERVQRRMREQG